MYSQDEAIKELYKFTADARSEFKDSARLFGAFEVDGKQYWTDRHAVIELNEPLDVSEEYRVLSKSEPFHIRNVLKEPSKPSGSKVCPTYDKICEAIRCCYEFFNKWAVENDKNLTTSEMRDRVYETPIMYAVRKGLAVQLKYLKLIQAVLGDVGTLSWDTDKPTSCVRFKSERGRAVVLPILAEEHRSGDVFIASPWLGRHCICVI